MKKNLKTLFLLGLAKKMLFLAVILFSQFLHAENATAILDKAAAKFKAAGNVKIGFQVVADGGSTTGYIDLAGNKFHCDLAGTTAWFNGTDLWHYVKANDEVNITCPTAAEAARLNPYSFISHYKKNYTCKMGKSKGNYHEVVLTGKKGSTYQSVVVRIDKSSLQPIYIKTVSTRHTTEFTVNSYLTNQKFAPTTFNFDKKQYPNVEVVDLR